MEKTFVSYPNQRKFTIDKHVPQKEMKKPFIFAYTENIERAAQELSGEIPFKLYIYFISNDDKYNFWFSPTIFANKYGVSVGRAREALKELTAKGYITECGSNQYVFHDEPKEKEIAAIGTVGEKRWIECSSGTMMPITYEQLYNQFHGKVSDDEINQCWSELEVYEEC